jgi:uncharacterized damage-inducible protein DinB
MGYGGKDIARSFRTVRENTIKSAEEIPEDQYDFRPTPDVRSVRQLLDHIAVSPSIMLYLHQNNVTRLEDVPIVDLIGPLRENEAKPRNKAETLAFLKSEGEKFATFVEGLSDAFLAEAVTMRPGEQPATKTRFEMLLSPKEHEMHHRGQLMLIERLLGAVPHLTRQREARMAQAGARR